MSLRDKPVGERVRLAEQVRGFRSLIAQKVTDDFLAAHPAWKARYGERAGRFGVEDALYHVDFLAAAIEIGDPNSFGDYLRWTAGLLQGRNIASRFLIETVRQISRELEARLPEPRSREVADFVDAALDRTLAVETELPPDPVRKPLGDVQELYRHTILTGQRQAAVRVALEAVEQGHSILDIYADVLQDAMYAVGQLWEGTRITVAQEHMATAITQHVIAHLFPLIEPARPPRGKIVVTGVEGEQHQVGANIVADALESQGWDVRFLGANVPRAAVLKAIEEHDAEVLGISAALLIHLPGVRRLVEEARALPGRNLQILLGGCAFRTAYGFADEVGAAGVAVDVRSAVKLAAALPVGQV
jgi:methylmalonyl-CoA mutase cobalamin-binding domain/chain